MTPSRRAPSSPPRTRPTSSASSRTRTRPIDTAKIQLRLAKASLTDADDAAVTAQIRQAKIGVNNATSQLADATKTRDDLKTQIRLATLTAPIDGIVTAVNVVKGLDAPSGDAIVIDATDVPGHRRRRRERPRGHEGRADRRGHDRARSTGR